MAGYTKLFSSIVGSTIWREDSDTRVVWVTMLALADQGGVVEASVPGLADLARVSVEQAKIALAKFMAPDEYSRTPDFEGRRIEPVDGGWLILNHGKYREKLSAEYKKARAAMRQKRHRASAVTQKRDTSVTECDMSRLSHQADTHTEASSKEKENNTHTPAAGAAKRVCVELSLTGTKNQDAIQEVINSEAVRTSQSPDQVAERMIAAWSDYVATPGKQFEYSSPLAFFQRGCWLRPESWKPAQSSKQPKPEKTLTQRLIELGQLGEDDVRPAVSKYVPTETDEDCEKRLILEGRERRARMAREKAARENKMTAGEAR